MSFVITKAGMWHAKGLEIAIDDMEEKTKDILI